MITGFELLPCKSFASKEIDEFDLIWEEKGYYNETIYS